MKQKSKKLFLVILTGVVLMASGCKKDPEPVEYYICPNCQEKYNTLEEAASCCGVQIETVTETNYVCSVCEETYSTLQEAIDCCGTQYVTVKKYICSNCLKEYDTKDAAKNCCDAEPDTITKYVCSDCGKEYTTKETALICCADTFADLTLFQVSTDESGEETKTLIYEFGKDTFITYRSSNTVAFTNDYLIDVENKTLTRNYKSVGNMTIDEYVEEKLNNRMYKHSAKMTESYKNILDYQISRKVFYNYNIDEENKTYQFKRISRFNCI